MQTTKEKEKINKSNKRNRQMNQRNFGRKFTRDVYNMFTFR